MACTAIFSVCSTLKKDAPDYLLDPSVANSLVIRSQKINAFAIYNMDCIIRSIFDMPQDETKEVIARLAAEINYPIDFIDKHSDLPRSERIRKGYEICKENGELDLFWQFYNAVLAESAYIISNNSDLFFSKISEEQWEGFMDRNIKSHSLLTVKNAFITNKDHFAARRNALLQ